MIVPAPDYESLYDFETQIETAFAELLEEKTTISSHGQRSEDNLPVPRYEFQATTGAATGHYGKAKDGLVYPDAFECVLRCRHVTSRRNDFSLHDHRRNVSALRRWMYRFETQITSDRLPYLTIDSILETGSTQGVDPDNELDITDISFAVAFAIRPNAWPLISAA